ncbi:MAG: arsenate reductase ArsC [Candidatus Electrothrix sp. ATG1]|nr:arsenate reductase ArsC [Candidatus Electrothrix sp. ATG1]
MLKKVLFVCVENACRSQMAEAFARLHGQDCLEVASAGSRPSGKVNEKAILSMNAVGYDLSQHVSQAVDDLPATQYDLVVTMGCGDTCPSVAAAQRQDWKIPDPKDMDRLHFGEVRDMIEQKVLALLNELNCCK